MLNQSKLSLKTKPSKSFFSNIKTDLIAWYDFNSTSDSHGTYDLTEDGVFATPIYDVNFADTDSLSYFLIPVTLIGGTSGVWVPSFSMDGTFLLCMEVGSFSNGAYFFNHNSETYIRYTDTGAWTVNFRGISVSNGPFPQPKTPLLIGGRLTRSAFLFERIIDGQINGTKTVDVFSAANVSAFVGHNQTTRLYWMGFWNRKLSNLEIKALYDYGPTLRYDRFK